MKGSIKMQQAAILNSNLIWLSRKKWKRLFGLFEEQMY